MDKNTKGHPKQDLFLSKVALFLFRLCFAPFRPVGFHPRSDSLACLGGEGFSSGGFASGSGGFPVLLFAKLREDRKDFLPLCVKSSELLGGTFESEFSKCLTEGLFCHP